MAVTITGNSVQFPTTFSNDTYAQGLDDYEQGTWTPGFSATGGTITSMTNYGVYTKIGNVVTFNIDAAITNVGSASGYYIYLTGFPFSKKATAGVGGFFRERAVNGYLGVCYLSETATQGQLIYYANAGTAAGSVAFGITGMYFTDQ